MDKEDVVHIYNGISLSHKRNKIGSFIELDLETVIQSEVSQKEKNEYRILMHNMWILEKWYTDGPIFRAGIEMQI